MKPQPYLFILAVSGLAIVTFVTLLGAPRLFPGLQPQPLSLALSDWPGDQVFAFVDLLHLDAPHHLDLDLRRVPAVDDLLATWRNGLLDTQIITLDAGFTLAEDDDIRIIYAYDASFGADAMVAANPIRSVDDLRGQTIGVEFGYPSHFLTLNILARAGLSPTDVTLVDVQIDEVETALASGRVAAITTWEPKVSDLLAQRADWRVLSSSRDFPALILNVIVVRASALEQNRAVYVNLIRATDAAIRQCKRDLRPCLERLAIESGRSVVEWEADFKGIRLLDLADNQQLFKAAGPDGLAAKLAAVHTFLRANRPDMPAFDISQWLDGSLVQEAAAQ